MDKILISINPKSCYFITKGIKTVELRLNKPSAMTPFKCYIYCTKGKLLYEDYPDGITSREIKLANFNYTGQGHSLNGKIIGEFICDRIDKIYESDIFLGMDEISDSCIAEKSCLSSDDILKYKGSRDYIYSWNISNLVIYDIPKRLDNLSPKNYKCRSKNCVDCKYLINEDMIFGLESIGCFRYVDKAPKGWQYID